MSGKGAMVILAALSTIMIAAALSLVLTASAKTARADAVYVDAVPTALPSEGVRIDPPANVLLTPASEDPGTLGVSSASQAISLAPQNSIPEAKRAILANVTSANIPSLNGRLAWVVTYQWNQEEERDSVTFGGPSTPKVPPYYVEGQVIILDAQTGELLLGLEMVDHTKSTPQPSGSTSTQPSASPQPTGSPAAALE